MEQVIQALKRDDAEKRIPVLRLELDYELLSLHDALLEENLVEIEACKRKLARLRKEMLMLEAYLTLHEDPR